MAAPLVPNVPAFDNVSSPQYIHRSPSYWIKSYLPAWVTRSEGGRTHISSGPDAASRTTKTHSTIWFHHKLRDTVRHPLAIGSAWLSKILSRDVRHEYEPTCQRAAAYRDCFFLFREYLCGDRFLPLSVRRFISDSCAGKDEDQAVRALLQDDYVQTRLFRLRGSKAQLVIDLIDRILVCPVAGCACHLTLGNEAARHFTTFARRLYLSLTMSNMQLPSSLILDDVISDLVIRNGGGQSNIYRGRRLADGGVVALKERRLYTQGCANESLLRTLLKDVYYEAALIRSLAHANIAPVLGIAYLHPEAPIPCTVYPWMERGTLLDYLRAAQVPSSQLIYLMREVTGAVSYLHSNQVIHGGLRCASILVDHDGHCRISDFGRAIFAQKAAEDRLGQDAGSSRWMAPEVLHPDQFGKPSPHRITPASDVYALGTVFWEAHTLRVPYSEIPLDSAVRYAVIQGARPGRPGEGAGGRAISNELWQLINDCWSPEAKARPLVHSVLERLES